jgi:hypothetical protein
MEVMLKLKSVIKCKCNFMTLCCKNVNFNYFTGVKT